MSKWAGRGLIFLLMVSVAINAFEYAWILHLEQTINTILSLTNN